MHYTDIIIVLKVDAIEFYYRVIDFSIFCLFPVYNQFIRNYLYVYTIMWREQSVFIILSVCVARAMRNIQCIRINDIY